MSGRVKRFWGEEVEGKNDRTGFARWGGRLLAVVAMVPLVCGRAEEQGVKPSQSDVQAVYLYNFAKFVRWPVAFHEGNINICIAGQPAYVGTLKKIVGGESIDGHPLSVKPVQKPEEEAGCDILFLDATVKDRLEGLLAASAGKPVLTVSDTPGFLDRGGMIQFVVVDQRVRFAVDLTPLKQSGIGLSSELLKVAVSVKPAGEVTP